MATLSVYFEQRRVGTIDIDKNGPGFTYDPGWVGLKGAFSISITMPLGSERIASDTFLPWAANLLPESVQLRTLGQLFGMARGDVIGLLSAIGGDTAGALSIGQPGRTASLYWHPIEKPEDLERLIEELPSKPFLVGDEGVSMSLAGVQTKLAVAVDQTGCVCVPMNGSPSTHILKPDAPRLWGSVQNEAFCLTLARRMKIPTPSVTTGQAGKRTYLLVKRFDRTEVSGRWRRLHQEDYCQALGKPPSAKYEANQTGIRGPALEDMFELTRRHMPSIDIVHLLDMVVVNVLACNTDAHAKNYAIIIRGNGASIAPSMIGDNSRALKYRSTVERPDYVAIEASRDRLELADKAGALEMGLDLADTIQADNSMEKMLVHQMAAAHNSAMRMIAVVNRRVESMANTNQLTNMQDIERQNIETCRLAGTVTRMMNTFQQGMLTLQRVRTGGEQRVVVEQHQYVTRVEDGGQAVIGPKVRTGGVRNGGGGGSQNAQ